jgi:hypothetical protein
MTQAALVVPETTVGMIEASATRRAGPAVDAELGADHGHRVGGRPIMQVPLGRAGRGDDVVDARRSW